MKDHHRLVIVSDVHLGAERRPWLRKLGVTPEQWDAPFQEAARWSIENEADAFIVAGDLFDQRRPTPLDYMRARQVLGNHATAGIVVAGNHDIGVTGDVDALWAEQYTIRGRPRVESQWGIQLVGLPWPRPSDWELPEGTIEDDITLTRSAVFNRLEDLAANLDPERPAILVGHCMVAYGGYLQSGYPAFTEPDGPGLMLGKDVVLPYTALTDLPNIGGVFLGHVHNPSQPGYVGSTQPTDWGEAGQAKSFTVVDITRCDGTAAELHENHGPVGSDCCVNGWAYETRKIPYTTSLKLLALEGEFIPPFEITTDWWDQIDFHSGDAKYDGIRSTVTVKEGDNLPIEDVRNELLEYADYVEVIVEREVKRAARVETAEPLAHMSAADALDVWLEQRGTNENDLAPVREAFGKIVESS